MVAFRFSLSDLEHGLLRGNKRPPGRLSKLWGKDDPRFPLAKALTPMDPRIHFALVCGARGCPPVCNTVPPLPTLSPNDVSSSGEGLFPCQCRQSTSTCNNRYVYRCCCPQLLMCSCSFCCVRGDCRYAEEEGYFVKDMELVRTTSTHLLLQLLRMQTGI